MQHGAITTQCDTEIRDICTGPGVDWPQCISLIPLPESLSQSITVWVPRRYSDRGPWQHGQPRQLIMWLGDSKDLELIQ